MIDPRDLVEFFDAPAGVSFNLTPAEAVAYFKAKGLRVTFDYRDLMAEEHMAAFTVAKMLDQDMLADVHASLTAAMESGQSFQQWADELKPYLQGKGWWGRQAITDPVTGQTIVAQLGSAGRLKTVFRTNMQSAYSVGAWQQIQDQKNSAPYLLYDAIDDHRTRPEHAAQDDKVYRVDDPFWQVWYPPNGYNCRCSVIQLDAEEVAALGLAPSPSPPIQTETWINPRTGKKQKVPVGQDPGFAFNAGQARLEQLAKLALEKLAALPPAQQAAGIAGQKAAQDAAKAALEAEVLDAQKVLAKVTGQEQLARSQMKAAKRAAQFQIDKALAEKTPYLSTAINQLKAKGAITDPAELLEAAKAQAAKAKQSNFLSEYKKAYLADKKPSANAQAAWDNLPEVAQQDILKVLDAQKLANSAEFQAQKALAEITTGDVGSKKTVLATLEADPAFAILPATQKLAKFEDAYKAFQAQKNVASALSNYKKAILAGKQPSAAQVAAFEALDDAAKLKFLAGIDKAKLTQAVSTAPDVAGALSAKDSQKLLNDLIKKIDAVGTDEAAIYAKALKSLKTTTWKNLSDQQKTALVNQAIGKLGELKGGGIPPAVPPSQVAPPSPKGPPQPDAYTPAGAAPQQSPLNPQRLTQVGGQGGSNPGGLYLDQDTGIQWYVKYPDNLEALQNELLAGKLYELAGVNVPELRLITLNGKPALASRIIDGLERTTAANLAKTAGTMEGFAADAWLANWDVTGLNLDNLLVKGGKAYRIDVGGSLLFRAQGTAKGSAFGDFVTELETLLDPKKNAQAAKVFGKITPAQLQAGVQRILAISDDQIRALVTAYGPPKQQAALIKRLIARRNDLAKRFPKLNQAYLEAQKEAALLVNSQAIEGLNMIDAQVIEAIKGIATRSQAGKALEAKDLTRVAAVRKGLEGWKKQWKGQLTDAQIDEAETFYQAWLDKLDEAIKPGTGNQGAWSAAKFNGWSKTDLDVDVANLKVEVWEPTAGGAVMSPAQGKKALAGVGASYSKRNTTAAWKKVPEEHQQAMTHYSGSYYHTINEALRTGRITPAQKDYANLLSEGLRIAPKFVGRSSRGVQLDGAKFTKFITEHQEAFKTGGTVVHRGFISSTVGDTPAFSAKNIWLHIDGKKGVHIRALSLHASENEVLLDHGSRFKVTDMKQKGSRWYIWLEEV